MVPPQVWQVNAVQSESSRSASKFAIVGSFGTQSSGHVQHVALLASDLNISFTEKVPVWHMRPPLCSEVAQPGSCIAHLIGDLKLSRDSRNEMEHWLAKERVMIRPDKPFAQYIVHPAIRKELAENNRDKYTRYSCVGFVLACYRAADIELLNEDAIPLAEFRELEFAFPLLGEIAAARPELIRRAKLPTLSEIGLEGSGPWNVILPGYLFHSLNRPSVTSTSFSPYQPRSTAEAMFP